MSERKNYFEKDGFKIRYASQVSEDSKYFEARLFPNVPPPLLQSQKYIEASSREFRIFQIETVDGTPLFQAVLHVGRPQIARWTRMVRWPRPFWGNARVPKLVRPALAEHEEQAYRLLRQVTAEDPSLMTLRLQPALENPSELADFELRARRAGFHLRDPIGTTRTLFLDLSDSIEKIHAGFDPRVRQKLRHRARESFDVLTLDDSTWISDCRTALSASRLRTGGSEPSYDFDTFFSLAQKHPDEVKIVGLFSKEDPGHLLAYMTAFRSGPYAEFSSAGSIESELLKSVPFNYFLVWELIQWAKTSGATRIDMGGVSDEGPGDPLAGISYFKRRFPTREAEIGREMEAPLRVVQTSSHRALVELRELTRRLAKVRLPSS